jgi:hypothetical protein
VRRLVDRWGRGGFGLATSLLWALPAAAWAGSVDLVGGSGPWLALGLAAVMFAVWVGLQLAAARVTVADRPRRFAVGQMGGSERAWLCGAAVALVILIGELNAAATVDWSLVGVRHARGLALVLAFVALVALTAAVLLECWRRAGREFSRRA